MSTQRAAGAPHPAHGWPAVTWEGLTARLPAGGYGLILRSEGKCLRFFLSDREAALLRETLAEAAQPSASHQPPPSGTCGKAHGPGTPLNRIRSFLWRIWPRKVHGA